MSVTTFIIGQDAIVVMDVHVNVFSGRRKPLFYCRGFSLVHVVGITHNHHGHKQFPGWLLRVLICNIFSSAPPQFAVICSCWKMWIEIPNRAVNELMGKSFGTILLDLPMNASICKTWKFRNHFLLSRCIYDANIDWRESSERSEKDFSFVLRKMFWIKSSQDMSICDELLGVFHWDAFCCG